MKAIKFILLLFSVMLLCNCEKETGVSVEQKIYGKMGYHSILKYRYMPYTADSVILTMRVSEIESSMRHYNKSSIYLGEEMMANSDILPFEAEIHIPIIDDSIFQIKHICYVDSIRAFDDTLMHTVYVHKNEVVNPQLDTVSIIRERVDSIIIRTYYQDKNKFWWL